MALEGLVKRQKEGWHIASPTGDNICSSSYSVSASTKAQRSSPPYLKVKLAYVTVGAEWTIKHIFAYLLHLIFM
jgi:hypothetical protein